MPIYQNYINNDQLNDFKFILSLIRAEINNEQADKIRLFLKTHPVDWRFILSLVDKHRVLPILYYNLKKMGLTDVCPNLIRKQFSSRYMEIIANNLRMTRKMSVLLELFETHGVPAIPFKGPILAHQLYGDALLRFYQDLDILVPKTYVHVCRTILEASGFVIKEKDLSANQYNQLLKYGRECDFTDAAGNNKIDLHWQLSAPFRQPYDYEFCMDRLQKVRFYNREIYSLSAEDTLLHLCVNGTHDIWCNLEKILCVVDFIDRHPDLDWDLVRKLADQLHCKRILLLGLFLAKDIFDVSLPFKIVDQIKKNKKIENIARNIYPNLFQGVRSKSHIEKRLAEIPYYLEVREHSIDKLLYLFRRIFIPTQKDRKNHAMNSRFSRSLFLTRPIDLVVELVLAFRQSFKFF